MKVKILMGLAALSLSACTQGPQTADEVRDVTAGNGGLMSMFAQRSSVTVSRSHSAVASSLNVGAKKCLNRTVRSTGTVPGPYGPQTSTTVIYYSATVKSSGGRTELAMMQKHPEGFLPQINQGGIAYVVDAVPVRGGTQLTFHGGKFGYKKLNAAVSQWARGGRIVCPDLPGSG